VLVFPAAVFAVHQLCYLLAYGSAAGSELAAHGDRYDGVAAILAVSLGALSLGLGLLRLAAAWRGRGEPSDSSAGMAAVARHDARLVCRILRA
jgi:hypothetical protein